MLFIMKQASPFYQAEGVMKIEKKILIKPVKSSS